VLEGFTNLEVVRDLLELGKHAVVQDLEDQQLDDHSEPVHPSIQVEIVKDHHVRDRPQATLVLWEGLVFVEQELVGGRRRSEIVAVAVWVSEDRIEN